jgi:hypothetical protein
LPGGTGPDLRSGTGPGSTWLPPPGRRAGGRRPDVCLWTVGYLSATYKRKAPHMVITGGTILLIVIIVLIVLFLRRA